MCKHLGKEKDWHLVTLKQLLECRAWQTSSHRSQPATLPPLHGYEGREAGGKTSYSSIGEKETPVHSIHHDVGGQDQPDLVVTVQTEHLLCPVASLLQWRQKCLKGLE